MNSESVNGRPLRRFASFSLRELCLLMLTVAAMAGWWRNSTFLGEANYSKIGYQHLEQAVSDSVNQYFAKLDQDWRVSGHSSSGSGGSSTLESRALSYQSEHSVRPASESKPPAIDWTERTLCETSALQKAILEHIQESIQSELNSEVKRHSGGTSLTQGSVFGSRTETAIYTYSIGSTRGMINIRVTEKWRRDSENQKSLRDGPAESIEVEVLLLETPAMVRRGS